MKATHSDRLQRWVGAEGLANVSNGMRDWYGPPIPMGGVPGNVYACRGGDFIGECRAGYEATADDYLRDIVRRSRRAARRGSGLLQMGGFATLADLIAEGRGGKRQYLAFSGKTGTALAGGFSGTWFDGGVPAAGAAGGATPGGTVFTSASTGALYLTNPPSGDSTFVTRTTLGTTTPTTALLHDRLWSVAKTMSSIVTEVVSGVPTRYTSNTPGAADYAAGNFLYCQVNTGLGAGAHNWTVCKYTDQDGNTGITIPSFAGINTQSAFRQDFTVGSGWFIPLAAGDSGLTALTQLQCDASITGAVDFMIGHPLAWMSTPVLTFLSVADGITSSFNLARVFDNACLSFLALNNASGSPTLQGVIELVSG